MIRWLFVVGLVVWTAGCAADIPENTEGRASGVAAAAPDYAHTAVDDSILGVVKEFLRAMTANDVGASRAVLLPGG